MSVNTSIEWTDCTWSPLRARRRDTDKVGQHCERVSAGCVNCYAARHNGRNLPNGGTGLDYVRGSRELVETFVDGRVLAQPLRWRKPRKVFACNQTDLFADFYTDEQRDRVFAVMALAPQHTFQVLTKRAGRLAEYFREGPGHCARLRVAGVAEELDPRGHRRRWSSRHAMPWPLSNVWLGVSVENQETADERIPILLDTPAAVRFVSAEPLLGAVNLHRVRTACGAWAIDCSCSAGWPCAIHPRLDWIIVGGESGPGARPCDVAWIRSIVEQCRGASVPCFVKQFGASPFAAVDELDRWPLDSRAYVEDERGDRVDVLSLRNRKGGDPSEWPESLRVREFPNTSKPRTLLEGSGEFR